MSDRRVRELVRELLVDMKPAEVIARVAAEVGFLCGPHGSGTEWADVWDAMREIGAYRDEEAPSPRASESLNPCRSCDGHGRMRIAGSTDDMIFLTPDPNGCHPCRACQGSGRS